jgi:hypothetical protein
MLVTRRRVVTARNVLAVAKRNLGSDLGGFSEVDLVLDSMHDLKDAEHARRVIEAIDAPFLPSDRVATARGDEGVVIGCVANGGAWKVGVRLDGATETRFFHPQVLVLRGVPR